MLGVLRENSKNAVIYLLFGVIIAVFIINFGPGSRGCEGGANHSYAARVAGTTISESEYRYAYIAQGFTQYPPQFAREQHLKERVMDKLIERELLAQEAERFGFDVSTSQVEQMIEEGRIFVLGVPRKADEFFKDGLFDYERLRTVCQNRLGVSVSRFIEVQRREMMADQVRQLFLGASKLPPDDVKADYEQKGLQVNLEFVRYSAHRYDDEIALTPAELAAYRKDHEAAIKKSYDDRPYLYKKLDKHAHLRHIVVNLAKGATEEDVQRARKRIDEAARRIKTRPFEEVARELSEDAHSRARGGESGWRKKGFTGLTPGLDDRVFAAKAGDVIGPERSDRGFELVKVEAFREGDLTLDQVALEIAEEQLRTERTKVRAHADAEKLIAEVKAGKALETLLPKPADGDTEAAKRGAIPQLQETGLFARRGEMVPEIGLSADLAKRAFELKQGEWAGPLDISGSFVVARLKERKEPDRDFFDKHKEEELRKAQREKWAAVIGTWTRQRCIQARDDARLKVNEEVLSYEGLGARESSYEPCAAQRF